jgi:4'-phosphopantetheinyl transferase
MVSARVPWEKRVEDLENLLRVLRAAGAFNAVKRSILMLVAHRAKSEGSFVERHPSREQPEGNPLDLMATFNRQLESCPDDLIMHAVGAAWPELALALLKEPFMQRLHPALIGGLARHPKHEPARPRFAFAYDRNDSDVVCRFVEAAALAERLESVRGHANTKDVASAARLAVEALLVHQAIAPLLILLRFTNCAFPEGAIEALARLPNKRERRDTVDWLRTAGYESEAVQLEAWTDQVLVRSWSLDDELLAGEAGEALLSAEERARGARFATAELRRRFVAGRAGLRRALGEHLGVDPRAFVFAENEFGKPRVVGAQTVHFNLSHSGGRAIVALSDTLEVGADLERIRPIEHLDLARRYFHHSERTAIEALAGDEEAQRRAFFLIWTLKEAIVKSVGQGLSIPLYSFAVSIEAPTPRLVVWPGGGERDWWLDVSEEAGYCRALAAPAAGAVGLIQRTL